MLVLYPYKNALWALRPAKPLGVLSRHPCRNPKPLPRGEGLCMLCWLCIVQSLWAYTPGVRAGLSVGLRPKQGRFGCLPKVLHDAKPTKQATLDTPFLSTIEVYRQFESPLVATDFQFVEKVYFYKNRANSLSLTPNPFPVGRGYITGATAPRPCRGLRPCDPIFINDRGLSTV